MKRRTFIVGMAATVGGSALAPLKAKEELPRLSESDPSAQALKYIEGASSSESVPKNQFCYNCKLYVGAKEDEWAGCQIFPGKQVAGKAWCSVWQAKV
ncbi:MAG: high-potential iron-sulfur protein [Pseudomonadota bacterium]